MNPDDLTALAAAGLITRPRPLYAGAVIGVDLMGTPTLGHAGDALRYGSAGLLPPAERVAVTADTVFDLASLTKLVTTLVALGELDDLDAPVADRLPGYRRAATENLTIRQLLTHTAGLPAELPRPAPGVTLDPEVVLAVDPVQRPGDRVLYSCVGFLVLQQLLEQVTGQTLDVLVTQRVADPLGVGLSYRPLDHGVPVDTLAATELRPGQSPDTRGRVHDEVAAALGGVAGNAGLFGTATDLLTVGRALLGALAGRRDFPGIGQERLIEAATPQVPATDPPGYASGLGFRIDDLGFMGGLAGRGRAYGHTGFTGTSLVLDAARGLVVVILTNRVHPSRDRSDLQPYRRRVHTDLARRIDAERVDDGWRVDQAV